MHSSYFRAAKKECEFALLGLKGLISGELIFGGAYYRKEFCISKWVWFVKKKQ